MNKFYSYPIFLQWIISFLFFMISIGLLSIMFILTNKNLAYLLGIFVVVPISQFLATPLFTLIKLYRYLSPMLLVVNPTKEKYDIHNGTSFDYWYIMRKTKAGAQWKNKMLLYYLEGLLVIIEKIENKELAKELEIRGSSYFFSDRTAQKFGFELKETGLFEKVNLVLNYLDLMWTYSAAAGRIKFPNLSNIKTATTTAGVLVENKQKLQLFKEVLAKRVY